MPVHKVGEDGYQYGDHGTIYYGEGAKKKAELQQKAAHAAKHRKKVKP